MKRLHRSPRELTPDETNARISTKVWDHYGSYQFFPTALRDRYLTQAMIDSGLFSCFTLEEGNSFASIGFFGVCRAMRTRVIRLPGYYKVLKPIFKALSFALPLPVIPNQGGRISYCHVFNHLADGPQGLRLWKELLAHAIRMFRRCTLPTPGRAGHELGFSSAPLSTQFQARINRPGKNPHKEDRQEDKPSPMAAQIDQQNGNYQQAQSQSHSRGKEVQQSLQLDRRAGVELRMMLPQSQGGTHDRDENDDPPEGGEHGKGLHPFAGDNERRRRDEKY